MKELYEVLYKYTDYGDMDKGRCPAYRILSNYINWIEGPICDLGCGRGNLVKIFRDLNCVIDGYDYIKSSDYVIEKDITKPINLKKYKTAICIDVFEHMFDDGVNGVIDNLKQTERQVLTVHIGKSEDWVKGVDLHINIKPFPVWDWIFKENFNIYKMYNITDHQRIYLTENKNLSKEKSRIPKDWTEDDKRRKV